MLRNFSQALKSEGVEVSISLFTLDAAGASGGMNGQFVILAVATFAAAIREVRKLIETLLKARDGRKLKLQVGSFRVEGGARDVEKICDQLVSSEQFRKLSEAETRKKRPRPSRPS